MKFKDLKDKYEVKVDDKFDIRLARVGRVHAAKGIIKNHKWYQYNIESNQKLPFEYSSILVTPYFVTEKMRNEPGMVVIKNGDRVTKVSVDLPHIDGKTGNFHAESFNITDEIGECEIKQIVACYQGHSGPKIKDSMLDSSDKNYYRYIPNKKYIKEEDKFEKLDNDKEHIFFVPKAAYYPLYDEKRDGIENVGFEDCANKKLNTILKAIWDKLNCEG